MTKPIEILDQQQVASLGARARAESIGDAGTLFFGDDLTHDIQDDFREMRPELSAEKVIVFDGSVPFAAREVRYRQYTAKGAARPFEAGGSSLNTVDVGGKRKSAPLDLFGVKLAWDFRDQEGIDFARMQGQRLPDLYAELTRAALRAIAEYANQVAWFGNDKFAGLFAQPFSKKPAGVKISEGTTDSGEAIASAVLKLLTDIERETKSTLRPNVCVWSLDAYLYAETHAWKSDSSDLSILDYIKGKRPDVMHERSFELDSVSLAGKDAGSCIVAGHRSMETARVVVTAPRFFAVQELGGGMSYEQCVLAGISDTLIPQAGAYAMLTRCNS